MRDWHTGAIRQVNGRPAFVSEKSAKTPRGELMFFLGDTLVDILGDGTQSADELSAVAQSMTTPAA